MRTFIFTLLFGISAPVYADAIAVSPSSPTNAAPTILIIDGTSPAFPIGAFLRAFTIQGTSIRVEGCYPFPSFSGNTPYQLTVNLGLLAPASYSVQYFTANCDRTTGNPVDGFLLQATTTFVVAADTAASAIPTIGGATLGLLSLILAALGAIWVRQRP
jgi:hypothetical protein